MFFNQGQGSERGNTTGLETLAGYPRRPTSPFAVRAVTKNQLAKSPLGTFDSKAIPGTSQEDTSFRYRNSSTLAEARTAKVGAGSAVYINEQGLVSLPPRTLSVVRTWRENCPLTLALLGRMTDHPLAAPASTGCGWFWIGIA